MLGRKNSVQEEIDAARAMVEAIVNRANVANAAERERKAGR
jgi:hypothetical protein